jgi:hypothetical protein
MNDISWLMNQVTVLITVEGVKLVTEYWWESALVIVAFFVTAYLMFRPRGK